MKMRLSAASPYVRKVNITAALKGLSDRIELVDPDKIDDAHPLATANPLNKVPTLVLDNGTALFDSPVICEYLDSLKASPVLFPDGGARWPALTRQALGDGIMDAGILILYEGRYRPAEMQVQAWLDMQQAKIDGAIKLLNGAPPKFDDSPDIGHISIACARGHLDFRHGGRWRAAAPALVSWLDDFAAAVPSFGATKPVG